MAHTGFSPPNTYPSPPSTLQSTINKLGDDKWPLNTAWFPNEGREIAEAIQASTAIGVSDGSYKPEQAPHLAAAAWQLQSTHNNMKIGGVLRVSGTERETNAYRAELQGLHAMLLAIQCLCTYHDIDEGQIILGLDNEKGVQLSTITHLEPPASLKHVDLIRAIRRIIHDLPIKVLLMHVQGHQDDDSSHKLTPMEQLNVEADALAKAHLDKLIEADKGQILGPCPNHIHKEGTRLLIDGTKITSQAAPTIRHAVFAPAMRQYLDSRDLLSAEAFDLVDWQAIRRASENSPPLFRLWASKNACGQCGVGKWMERWKYWDDSRCPLCLHPEETARHVPICPSAVTRQAFQEGLTQLTKKLQLNDTHDDISQCLIQGIQFRHLSFSHFATPYTLPAAMEQDQIGWEATIEGRISSKWASLQGGHLLRTASKRQSHTWAASAVEGIWEFTHHIWTTRSKRVNDMRAEEEAQTTNSNLNSQIRELYNNYTASAYTPEDRYLFTEMPLETRLAKSPLEKRTWLQAVSWASEVAEAEQHNENNQMRNAMAQWLQQGQPT